MRKVLIFMAGLFLAGTIGGCLTTNWAHNRRHFKKIREELRELHIEIDRVFFDLDPDPGDEI